MGAAALYTDTGLTRQYHLICRKNDYIFAQTTLKKTYKYKLLLF